MNYEYSRLKKIAENVSGVDVLDIGYAALPNPYLLSHHCTGYDLALPNINSGYLEEIQGDVNEINNKLQGYKFDTIILGELIEHVENPYHLLDSLHQLLKGNKQVIISTPNPLGLPVCFCELFNIKRYFYDKEHKYYFLPRWTERLIQQSDYEIERIIPVGLLVPGLSMSIPSPKILSYQLIYVCKSIRSEYL